MDVKYGLCRPGTRDKLREAKQMRVIRRIEGVSRLDRVRNVNLRDRLKQERVLDAVKKQKQKWKQRVE